MSEVDEPITEEQVREANGDEPEPDAAPPEEPNPDDEPGAPEAPEEEPAPPSEPPTDAAMEKRFQAAEKATKAYVGKLAAIFEEAAQDLELCPLCPAQHKGLVNLHDAGRVPQEVSDAVMLYLGFARPTDYKQDEETRTCPRCEGHGKTQTGSLVPGNETRKCPGCQGYGYVPPPAGAPGTNGHAADFHLPAGESDAPLVQAERDSWGEPRILPDGRENPNYGKQPAYKILVPPYGITAGLVAQDAVV